MHIPLALLLLITSPVPGSVLSPGNAKMESGEERPISTHGSMEPSGLQQKLRASGFGGAGICQGWGKEGLGCSIFRIPALCLMGVDFPEQVRSTRRNVYLWCTLLLLLL